MVTLNLAIGQQTPPVASVLITSCSIAKANIWDVSKVNVYFVGVLLLVRCDGADWLVVIDVAALEARGTP